jgi:hypothetical protein
MANLINEINWPAFRSAVQSLVKTNVLKPEEQAQAIILLAKADDSKKRVTKADVIFAEMIIRFDRLRADGFVYYHSDRT